MGGKVEKITRMVTGIDGKLLRQLGEQVCYVLSSELDVQAEVYLDDCGLVVFHFLYLMEEVVRVPDTGLFEAVSSAGISFNVDFQ